MNTEAKKIYFSGGATGGSVTPLIALIRELRSDNSANSFGWIGTRKGLEKDLLDKLNIPYYAICSGKLRRYFSLYNLIDPLFILLGFFQAFALMLFHRPSVLVTAGGFVAVPSAWAAWLLRIPVIVHQMDVRPGLANKLMAPFARVITTTFEKSINDYGPKAIQIGNPVRPEIKQAQIINKEVALEKFGFNKSLPVLLVVGGGTGALGINRVISNSLDSLTLTVQIIHQTGTDKSAIPAQKNYYPIEFLNVEKMAEAYAAADIVVTRAGMGFLTELSYLGKTAIIIPIPNSHQEDNAKIFSEANAAIVLKQESLTSELFVKIINKLISEKELKAELEGNIRKIIPIGAEKIMIQIINQL